MQTAFSTSESLSSNSAAQSNRITSTRKNTGQRRESAMRLRFDPSHPSNFEAAYAVVPAIEGSHFAIQSFLQRMLHRPSRAEFNSAILRPGYQPAERLLVKNPDDRSLIAHVQLEPQSIRFGRSEIPACRMRDLAVLPEFRQRGFADRMVSAAEAQAKRSGAMLMVARGEGLKLLQKQGWSTLGSDPVSLVSPQRFLGQLPGRPTPESPFYKHEQPNTEVRIGRLTDVEDLQSLWDRGRAESHGSFVRSTEKWSWLVSRRAHDRIYIFVRDQATLAYVVVRGASVVELIDLTEDGQGSARLMERVGADAIDQGRHTLRLHAPVDHPIHHWADAAGGQVFAATVEDSWMVKILSMRTLLRRLANDLHRRRPPGFSELSVRIGGEEILLRPGVRSLKVTRGASLRHRIGITSRSAAQLILGYQTIDELVARGEVIASDEGALKVARELFPPMLLWRGHWDEIPVITS